MNVINVAFVVIGAVLAVLSVYRIFRCIIWIKIVHDSTVDIMRGYLIDFVLGVTVFIFAAVTA